MVCALWVHCQPQKVQTINIDEIMWIINKVIYIWGHIQNGYVYILYAIYTDTWAYTIHMYLVLKKNHQQANQGLRVPTEIQLSFWDSCTQQNRFHSESLHQPEKLISYNKYSVPFTVTTWRGWFGGRGQGYSPQSTMCKFGAEAILYYTMPFVVNFKVPLRHSSWMWNTFYQLAFISLQRC